MNPFANWSAADVDAHNARVNPKKILVLPDNPEPVDLESKLHQQIIDYCDAQWPRWKYIRARMDKRSTIGNGVHDFTIFAPGRVICVECKARNEKLRDDQQIWKKELEMLGIEVHVVRNLEEFLKVASDPDRLSMAVAAFEKIIAMQPCIDGGGCFYPMHDGDGEYIGEQNVDPLEVIQGMSQIAQEFLQAVKQ